MNIELAHLSADVAVIDGRRALSRRLQIDSRGCTLACIAMLAGTTYEQIAELAEAQGWLHEIRRSGTIGARKSVLLAMSRVAVGRMVSSRRWKSLQQLAIVTIYYPEIGTWHDVVYDPVAGGVLDPSLDVTVDVRRDFRRMPMVHYIPVLQVPTHANGPRPFRMRRPAGYPIHDDGETGAAQSLDRSVSDQGSGMRSVD